MLPNEIEQDAQEQTEESIAWKLFEKFSAGNQCNTAYER